MKKPKFTTDWFTQSAPVFEKVLEELKGKPELEFLEIGTWEGRSAIWFLDNILTDKTSKITCIDDFNGIDNINNANIKIEGLRDRLDSNLKPYRGKFEVYDGNSRDVLRVLSEVDNFFDCVYIDGSHSAYDCLFDAVQTFPMVKKGGFIIFDDYMWNWSQLPDHRTPKLAIDSFMSCLKGMVKPEFVGWKTVILRKIV